MAMFSSTPHFLAPATSMGVSPGATATVAPSYPKGATISITNSPMVCRCSTVQAACTHLDTPMDMTALWLTALGNVITHTLTTTITWVLLYLIPYHSIEMKSLHSGVWNFHRLMKCLCCVTRVGVSTQRFPKQSHLIVWAVRTSATITGKGGTIFVIKRYDYVCISFNLIWTSGVDFFRYFVFTNLQISVFLYKCVWEYIILV